MRLMRCSLRASQETEAGQEQRVDRRLQSLGEVEGLACRYAIEGEYRSDKQENGGAGEHGEPDQDAHPPDRRLQRLCGCSQVRGQGDEFGRDTPQTGIGEPLGDALLELLGGLDDQPWVEAAVAAMLRSILDHGFIPAPGSFLRSRRISALAVAVWSRHSFRHAEQQEDEDVGDQEKQPPPARIAAIMQPLRTKREVGQDEHAENQHESPEPEGDGRFIVAGHRHPVDRVCSYQIEEHTRQAEDPAVYAPRETEEQPEKPLRFHPISLAEAR
jgi:hypothetical protein